MRHLRRSHAGQNILKLSKVTRPHEGHVREARLRIREGRKVEESVKGLDSLMDFGDVSAGDDVNEALVNLCHDAWENRSRPGACQCVTAL